MEEIFRDFIRTELYEVVDLVVAKQYDPEKKIDVYILDTKAEKLKALVNEYQPSEDLPEYRQAMFIISNACRYL